ncbi:MAG: hypothetical protein EBR86_03105 [Planctomycetia bacterium]|nr:hypothetical protein [Planctomycetia bacterium]
MPAATTLSLAMAASVSPAGADEVPAAPAPGVVVAEGPVVAVRLVEGETVTGRLREITAAAVVLDVDGAERRVPVEGVRRVDTVGAVATDRVAGRPAAGVVVWCTDGGWLGGDDFVWEGSGATVSAAVLRGSVRWALPAERVLHVDWPRPDGSPATGATPSGTPAAPAWQADLPGDADGDLIVVGGDEVTFVPCAISGVSAEAVTVVLDGETIPVKRAKVLGLAFLRPALVAAGPPAGSVAVSVTGGRLLAQRVGWSPAGLVLDGALRLPGAEWHSLDYAAGRTVDLAGLTPERVDVEPFFGTLARLQGMASFFAPRPLAAGGLLLRPRTESVYRIPTGGRRFRASVAPAVNRAVASRVAIVVRVDDREVFRSEVAATDPGAAAGPIDVDIAGGRRLTLLIDFGGPADPGFPVRFDSAVIDR